MTVSMKLSAYVYMLPRVFTYHNLLRLVQFWEEKGSKGFMMCMFELKVSLSYNLLLQKN
jgi:hypothetical protein